MVYRILVGSYSNKIYTLIFDPDRPSLTVSSSVTVGHHPSWVTPHPSDSSIIYAGVEQSDGRIVTVEFDAQGQGTILEDISSEGDSPCTLLALQDSLLIGNYGSGNLVAVPILEGTYNLGPSGAQSLTFTGSGPNQQRQEASHPHQVVFNPDRGELLVPDLGSDLTRRLLRDSEGIWRIEGEVRYALGSGPRHVAFHDGILYTVLELSNEVTAHRFPSLPEEPTFITSVPTMRELPPPSKEPSMLAAEILIPPPNQAFPIPLVYVSNRNDPSPDGDIISIFSIADTSKLDPVAEVRSGLKHLRGMGFGGPGDKYLIAGGAISGSVKVYERVDNGKALVELASVDVEAPTAFLWV